MEINKREYACLQKLEPEKRIHINCINRQVNETVEHFILKAQVAWGMIEKGELIVTEATFKGNKGRADIFNLSIDTVFEIVITERMESLLRKKRRYPVKNVIIVNAENYEDYMPDGEIGEI